MKKTLAVFFTALALAAVVGVGAATASRLDGCPHWGIPVKLGVEYRTYYVSSLHRRHASCKFTRAVEKASMRLIVLAGGAGDGDFYTRAFSTVTRRWYSLHCDAHGDLNSTVDDRMYVSCATLHAPVARVRYVAEPGP